ncbi:putative F-box protein At3g17500 [Aegilops tauschii subsp. strangulata]|uniref:Uncharacterized protein n=1 Tax=Aegilops tauschii TaxID=37682 RepID=M8CZ77_AEGTA|nr:F-box/kelch-repeat protein At3g44120-like [Aegilops tauschii subsp. strangulata]
MPYVPHEVIVSLVLPRLPVASLLRLRFLCKAWRDTIDNDDDFHRRHLRLQSSAVLIALQVPSRAAPHDRSVTTATLYLLEDSQKDAATLVHDMPYYHASPAGVAHDLAHCDGLVLVPTDTKVRVLNPATGCFVTLPWSTHGVRPDGFSYGHQAFGLGHDPSSNTYKVARFFYRSKHDLGMEVFTLGGQHCWRETAARPCTPSSQGEPPSSSRAL